MNAFLLVALLIGGQEDRWPALWNELETLLGGGATPAEASALRAHLTRAVDEVPNEPRGALLRASLEALQGKDAGAAAARLAALRPVPFTPREHWLLAAILPPGRARAGAVLQALATPEELARWQFFLAWNSAVDGARALRFEETALPIQRELHRRYQADWSAQDLALSCKAIGALAESDRLLDEAIAREQAAGRRTGHLWEQRGILALASGDERTSRDYLGRALTLGFDDAGLLLSRLDLMDGRTETARRGFRALVQNQPPPDWAWRGWGTALLPPAFTPAARHIQNQ